MNTKPIADDVLATIEIHEDVITVIKKLEAIQEQIHNKIKSEYLGEHQLFLGEYRRLLQDYNMGQYYFKLVENEIENREYKKHED